MSMPYDFGSFAPPTKRELVPRRLEPSVDPTNGALLVAPLTQVLLASTDALYSDLYNMAHGELEVVGSGGGNAAAADDDPYADENAGGGGTTAITKKSDRMSNLSFAQRRHELAWRLSQHARGLTQVAALTAANASTFLARTIQLCGQTLLHAHLHWRQADEAQDALYFHHGRLFSARAPPQDVYAALDVLVAKAWYELPSNLRLSQAANLPEAQWSKSRLQQEWELAVRTKLVQGEVGWKRRRTLRANGDSNGVSDRSPLWKLLVRGGIVRLVHGTSRQVQRGFGTMSDIDGAEDDDFEYPITAVLTVFSSSSGSSSTADSEMNADPPIWTLLSLDVRVQAKTGEFSHQLEASHRQKYDLHRLAARAMLKEEVEYKRRRQQQQQQAQGNNDDDGDQIMTTDGDHQNSDNDAVPAQPLQALFEVAQTFALSWQLELLSAQAQALRRGVWGAVATSSSAIHVSPVRFFDSHAGTKDVLGVVAVSFWKVDDAYGPPSIGELTVHGTAAEQEHMTNYHHHSDATNASQLTLAISAQVNVGVRVCLSGGQSMMEQVRAEPHLQAIANEIIDATSNPLELSVSNALLAATRLCAVQRCLAVVEALQPPRNTEHQILPSWIRLTAYRGSIAVAARVDYHGFDNDEGNECHRNSLPVLFQLECDSRTGVFVPTFARATKLLGELACNSDLASESMTVRITALPSSRRRAAAASSTGRAVCGMFDGLVRSMNILGERIGVGGEWDDLEDKSSILRMRAILSAGRDVKMSLIKCCGAAALYGLTPLSTAVGLGLDAVTDIAGDPIPSLGKVVFLPLSPLSILLDQELVEEQTKTDAVSKKTVHMQQSLYSFMVSASENELRIVPLNVSMKVISPSTAPTRMSEELSHFARIHKENEGDLLERPSKRSKLAIDVGERDSCSVDNIMEEAMRFAAILSATLEPQQS